MPSNPTKNKSGGAGAGGGGNNQNKNNNGNNKHHNVRRTLNNEDEDPPSRSETVLQTPTDHERELGEATVTYKDGRTVKAGKVIHTGQKIQMREQQKQHKFNPVTHQANKIPLWTSITAVNRELAKFAAKNDNVVYFDVSPYFTERDGKNTILRSDLITSFGIPTEAGFRVWESAVAIRAEKILDGT